MSLLRVLWWNQSIPHVSVNLSTQKVYGSEFELYHLPSAGRSPRLEGSFSSNYPYPALAFILVVPFQAIGLPGTLLLTTLAQIIVLVLIFIASPRLVQPLILLPLVTGVDFTFLSLIGLTDIIWVTFLVGMILCWRRTTWRAILFGLAIATKQTPMLLVPFLWVRLWHDEENSTRIYRISRFSLVTATIFFLINAPFIFWDIQAWLLGLSEPVQDTLILLSQGGLSTLTQFGLVNLPKNYFLFTTLVILTLLVSVYWRHYADLRETLWVMPGILMWFSFRTLESYWIYWTFPAVAALITRKGISLQSKRGASWRFTIAMVVFALIGLLVFGSYLAVRTTPVLVQLRFPVLMNASGQVARISVNVNNNSDRSLTPRFAIQNRASTLNPLPWDIDSGPLTLLPGQSAIYQISTGDADRAFFAHDEAQIVVTDARGDYALRGLATIAPDRSYLFPDAIPNPSFLYWDAEQQAPIFWNALSNSSSRGSVALTQKDGRDALTLTLNVEQGVLNGVALDSWIMFPTKPFGIWIYSEAGSNDSTGSTYGLEFVENQHRVWFLFGSSSSAGRNDGQYIIYRTITPRSWVYQEIDLAAAYASAGWQLPPLRHTIYRGLDTDLRTVSMRLFLVADGPPGNFQAFFGPIQQREYVADSKTLMAETLDNPADYYLRVGDFYERGRNYGRAAEAYQYALQFSPTNAQIINRLNSARQHLIEAHP